MVLSTGQGCVSRCGLSRRETVVPACGTAGPSSGRPLTVRPGGGAPGACASPAWPALVLAQQRTELDGGLPDPWPLPEEVARAARHDLPLAPPFSR